MKIGIILPIGENDDGILDYGQIRGYALQAETAGLDSLWLADHLIYRFPEQPERGVWEVWSLLAALAEATNHVELGTLVMCTAFRNPALLAKMAVTVDAISSGRFTLGLGAGWHKPEFDAFGLPFDHLGSRFAEAMQIIVPLVREGEVDFTGSYYSAPNCTIRPRGPRPNGPPILVGAFKPRLLRLTAQHADMWNTCWLGPATQLDERLTALHEACAEAGRDPATLTTTVGVVVGAPGDDEPPNPEKMLCGTVEEVAAGLRAYAERGVAHVICYLTPFNAESLNWLAEAARLARAA
ncbi:MAG: LLM class flavin-dependent oxidoreductase [Chloroflexaceae bacterium]|jgi:probable F420-dependent oxidoreductase|nr:LLM class flavin-dependent oxidoreductase [Chloroflexaceae bacterium]